MIAIFIGIAACLYGSYVLWKALETGNWPFTSGTIINSTVAEGLTKSYSRESWMPGSSRYLIDVRYYRVRVQYQYSVAGKRFDSSKIVRCASRAKAQSILKKHRPGMQIQVHYNAGKPAQSVLEPGARLADYYLLGFGLTIVLLGVLDYFFELGLVERIVLDW